ncbi:hypothetical protein K2173_025732 [Erythroxylum novogranatense]|uniref:Outer membrane protein beta-barrel domain-containing protein n=1 Tax=Erythroxylum novogranatense TaxID=1862640 RepID=A0AAV8SBM6_9ROSI|nr:hypothetical protein K2173_025732 [Erythroxylum novogranatense]
MQKPMILHINNRYYVKTIGRHVHGELDTKIGAPLSFGVHYTRHEKLHYNIRGKKAFHVTNDGLLNFNRKPKRVAELSCSILNFQKHQDVRFKVGYEVINKVPYFHIKENNWNLNAYMNGRWNVRFDL